jgi:hypothetical protein
MSHEKSYMITVPVMFVKRSPVESFLVQDVAAETPPAKEKASCATATAVGGGVAFP